MIRWLTAIFTILIMSSWTKAFAQGCIMCKTSLTGSSDNADLANRINFAILILLIPVIVLFFTIIVTTYHYRNSFNRSGKKKREQMLPILDSETDSALL
jgi:hypothetical protein